MVTAIAVWLVAAMMTWIPISRHAAFEKPEVTEQRYFDLAIDWAEVALEEPPLFGGDGGRERGVLLIASVGSYESEYNAKTIAGLSVIPGDNDRDLAVGAFQTHVYGKTQEGWSRADVAGDNRRQAQVALRMVRESLRVCRGEPPEAMLAHYAGGGPTCARTPDALNKSEHRVRRAQAWWRAHPFVAETRE